MKRVALVLGLLLLGASACLAHNDWEQIDDDDGIKVWRREIEGSPVVAFKGEAIVEASIAKVANVLDDTPRKLEWVAEAVEERNVRIISPTERIEYNRTHAPWPISDRDFVYHCGVTLDRKAKTVVVALHSVKDPLAPEDDDKAVRGELLDSRYTLVAVGDHRTRVTVEIHADPKGSIPKWVVNLFQKSWPRKTLEGIRAQCAKSDVKELALVKQWLASPDAESAGTAVAAVSSASKKG